MIRIGDICSLTDFHRHSKSHVRRLKRTGRPWLLTMNGRAVLVVQDAAAYERLLSHSDGESAMEAEKRSAMKRSPA